MVNRKFVIGMLVILLVFGMAVIGCDNGSGGGGGKLKVINNYASPITRVVVGPDGDYLDRDGLNIISSQTFTISDFHGLTGAYTDIYLYASGLDGGRAETVTWVSHGLITTVTLTAAGNIEE